MPNNMILLETIALTQSAASVTFDNLPTSGYTDLKIVMSSRADSTQNLVDIKFNSSSVGYTRRSVYGNGSSVSSASGSDSQNLIQSISTNTANTFGNTEIYIPNYRSSNNKSVSMDTVQENNATAATALLGAVLWSNTAAITSISLTPVSGNFVANSTFSLYGIAALGTTPVTAPKATGGNIVANDGTYWYHAFTSSGYFVPQVGLTADVLVVAGGGGGGNGGGGAGAGGLLAHTAQALANGTNYSCVVGAGGGIGVNGNNSQFAALTASAGGGGSSNVNNGAGLSGGSGGGGAGSNTGAGGGAGGAASPSGQGNAGGAGNNSNQAGGGGGASAAGASANSGSAGGNGSSAYSSWGLATNTGQNVSSTYWYAGGGGGYRGGGATSSGGNGGGGGSQSSGQGTNGIASTGGGSGGYSATGGSGIILIRYPIA